MKKLLAVTVALVAISVAVGLLSHSNPVPVVAAVTASRIAHASEASGTISQSPVIARHWESLGVAAGAIVQSPVLLLDNVSECTVYADNSAGGATRALNADCMGNDGTTVVYRVANTVAIAGRGLTAWGSTVAAATAPTGTVIQPGATCRKMQFTLAAAGAAAGSLAVDCR